MEPEAHGASCLTETTLSARLEFATAAAWAPDEKAYWMSRVERLSEAMAGLHADVPDVFVVKTSGAEEFNAAYTRNRSI